MFKQILMFNRKSKMFIIAKKFYQNKNKEQVVLSIQNLLFANDSMKN